jgi:hypothetical protein
MMLDRRIDAIVYSPRSLQARIFLRLIHLDGVGIPSFWCMYVHIAKDLILRAKKRLHVKITGPRTLAKVIL